MNEMVDVLIVGSGASGAAVAWSLADTRMKILCLEQGDWMKQADYPSNKRDWEARIYGDFATSPNVRGCAADCMASTSLLGRKSLGSLAHQIGRAHV